MNKVVAGRFKGKRIAIKGISPEIVIRSNERIPIDRLVVQRLQILNIEEKRKAINGFVRGYFGKMLGSTMWLSAIQSARPEYRYLCKLTFWDGSSSTILINSKTLILLSTKVDVERL